LFIAEVGNLTISHLHRHWVCDEPTKETSPLNYLGNWWSENLIQLLILFSIFFWLFVVGSWVKLNLRMWIIFKPVRIVHPREWLAIDSSRLFEFKWLIKRVNDTNKEVFSHFLNLFVFIWLAPLYRLYTYFRTTVLFLFIDLHKVAKEIMRDGLIFRWNYLKVMIKILICISVKVVFYLSA
jgi:hypothetical protein